MNYDRMSNAELLAHLASLQALSASDLSKEQLQRTLHDLHVHQIELELQNRELRETQQELIATRNSYADLYDFAPVGYVTLDDKVRINRINLTAAVMLGIERSRLFGKPFIVYVDVANRKKFIDYMRACKGSVEKISVEISLVTRMGGG